MVRLASASMKDYTTCAFFIIVMTAKTTYLSRLEALRPKLENLSAPVDSMPERLRLLEIFLLIFEEIRFFRVEVEQAKASVRINLDADINYDFWTNPRNWTPDYWIEQEEEPVSARLSQGWTNAAVVSLSDSARNELAGYFPNVPANIGFTDSIGRESVRSVFAALSGPYTNAGSLHYAICGALHQLCEVLNSLRDTLHMPRKEEEYANLAVLRLLSFNVAKEGGAADVRSSYRLLKEQHADSIDRDWLEDQIITALCDLYHTPFMQAKMKDVTRRGAAGSQIYYALDNVSDADAHRFYCALATFCSFDGRSFSFEGHDSAIGIFLYKHQNLSLSDQAAFFRFRSLVELIQTDMKDFPVPAYLLENFTNAQWDVLDAVFRSAKTMIGIYRKMAAECSQPQDYACMISVLYDYDLVIERNAYEDISRAFKVLGCDVSGNSLGYSLRKFSVRFRDWDYSKFRAEKDKCTSLEAHLSSFPGVKYHWN